MKCNVSNKWAFESLVFMQKVYSVTKTIKLKFLMLHDTLDFRSQISRFIIT